MEKKSQTSVPPSYNITTIPLIQDQNPPAISEKQSPTTSSYHMTATPPAQNPYIQPVGTPQASVNSGQLASTPQPFNQSPLPQPLSNAPLDASPPQISTVPIANYQTPTMTTPSTQAPAMMQQPQIAQAQFTSAQQLGSVPQQFGAVPQQPVGIQPQYTGFQQPPALQQQYSGFQQQQTGYQQHPGFQLQPPMGAPVPAQQYYSATPLRLLNQGSAPVDCPVCRQRQMTQITMEPGNTTHAWAIGFCVVFCLGFIPYLMTGLRDVRHNCGNCGALLATWHRSGRIVVHAHA